MTDNYDLDEDEGIQTPNPDFDSVLHALQQYDANQSGSNVTVTVYYGLSELDTAQIGKLKPVWEQLQPATRRKVMRRIAQVSETDFAMDYGTIGFFALGDPDPGVREAAIETLWMDESVVLMGKLVEIVQHDSALEVRTAAASALGAFVSLGEYEELPEADFHRMQAALIALWQDDTEHPDVRRRVLESLANCSHEIVPGAIDEAYHSDYPPMRVSAVFAMGRTCDDDRWSEIVMREIESDDMELRYEAARAAGGLALIDAVPLLGVLADEGDREIQQVAIWSLGEIGGGEAKRILSHLAEQAEEDDDEDLLDAIEDAIVNASLMDGLGL